MVELLHPHSENQEVSLITSKKPTATKKIISFEGKLEYLLINHTKTQQVAIQPSVVHKDPKPNSNDTVSTQHITGRKFWFDL